MTFSMPMFAVVAEEPHDCPYLPGQQAINPLRMTYAPITAEAFDVLLAEGDRRAGPFLYRPTCPTCTACEAVRIPLDGFRPSRSQRKASSKNQDLVVTPAPAQVSEERVALYNKHLVARGLDKDVETLLDEDSYASHYVLSCAQTVEIRYEKEGRLVGLSLLDIGRRSVSSVYHCFDPDEGWRSLGVFSVVREIELFRQLGFDWYYLGLWVEACAALSYKNQYLPHERLVTGEWQSFDRSSR